jgi:uncharacterized protein YuzE
MRLTFDPKADAAMVDLVDEIVDGEVVRTEPCSVKLNGASIILMFDGENRLLGLEILGASRVLPDEVLRGGPKS